MKNEIVIFRSFTAFVSRCIQGRAQYLQLVPSSSVCLSKKERAEIAWFRFLRKSAECMQFFKRYSGGRDEGRLSPPHSKYIFFLLITVILKYQKKKKRLVPLEYRHRVFRRSSCFCRVARQNTYPGTYTNKFAYPYALLSVYRYK